MPQVVPCFENMPEERMQVFAWLGREGRLDVLRDSVKLSEIVGRIVSLEEADHGEMRGPCPAHDHVDDQRSFFVVDRKGVFHCFGCGIHGDVIRWMTDYENVEYVEAVRLLIRRSGLLDQNPVQHHT